jgi:peptidoglycan hydrolase-like protein with peptidoglycan-binding domain
MGPKTRSAIVAFQRHYGLDVTGKADDATVARLKKEYRA